MSDLEDDAAIRRSVNSAVHGLNGVFTSLSWEGPANRAVLAIVYLASDDPAVIAAAVDDTFGAVWRGASFEASSIAVGAVVGVYPVEPTTWDINSLDPRPIGAALGVQPNDIGQMWIDIPRQELVARYGPRDAGASS